MIASKLIQKLSSDISRPGKTSVLRNATSSFETDNEPFFLYASDTFYSLVDFRFRYSLTNINVPLLEI